ncbi:neurogenic locus notch homolog protein 1-like [Symsagittifera roscoffensis]|uniref:neurogenic locus notch homolog protein 1-like n=1 Tax=Symsagittifera roscoffensis TaxID=84072 RepID=UPI00307BC726
MMKKRFHVEIITSPSHFLLLLLLLLCCSPLVVCQKTAPRDIEVSGITQNSATICWKQPAQGGPMREFQIVLSVKDDDSLNKFEYLSLDESQDPEDERNLCKQFTLLEPGVGYEVSVVGKGSPFAYKEQDMFYFKTRENPCSSHKCANGECTVTGEEEDSFNCMCFMGYYGTSCDMFNPCARKPCGEFECFNTTEGHFSCACPDGRSTTDPVDCLNTDPCANHKCQWGECVPTNPDDDEEYDGLDLRGGNVAPSYVCECERGYRGRWCEDRDTCQFVNCHNNGTCISSSSGGGTADSYHCQCQPGYTGANCEKTDPCRTSPKPCLHGGKCVPPSPSSGARGRSFECECPRGFRGDICESKDGCADDPCENGAECVNALNGEATCTCAENTYGKFCQYRDNCASEPCGDRGVCKSDKSVKDGFICVCKGGYFGVHCELQDPCVLDQPCQNNANCISNGNGSFECECEAQSGNWGNRCQYSNECIHKPCRNSGQCFNDTNSALGYRCKCPGTFDGQNCENINQCKNVTFCTGHGTCKDNMCICDDDYYGAHCENFNACEVIRPCKHSSECTPTGDNSYRCECDHGYHGTNCEKFDPCHAQPCFNGGSCVLQDDKMGYFTCDCILPYYGTRCELFNPCLFPSVVSRDQNGVCPRDFKCLNTTTGHLSCVPQNMNEWMGQGQGNSGGGEGGLLELKCAKDADCFNGGTCDARGSKKCNCKNGTYSGILCEKMNPCNDQSICNGRGVCRSDKGDNTAECECEAGWFGPRCEMEDPCGGGGGGGRLNCFNGGNCVRIYNPFSKITTPKCHCLDGFSGAECRERAKECVMNHCSHQGQCLSLGWNKDEETFRCVCPPAYHGPRCESLPLKANLMKSHSSY